MVNSLLVETPELSVLTVITKSSLTKVTVKLILSISAFEPLLQVPLPETKRMFALLIRQTEGKSAEVVRPAPGAKLCPMLTKSFHREPSQHCAFNVSVAFKLVVDI